MKKKSEFRHKFNWRSIFLIGLFLIIIISFVVVSCVGIKGEMISGNIEVKDGLLYANGKLFTGMIDFYGDACAPCRVVAPEVEKVAQTQGYNIMKINTETPSLSPLAQSYGVERIPAFVFFKDGKKIILLMGSGFYKSKIIEAYHKYCGNPNQQPPQQPPVVIPPIQPPQLPQPPKPSLEEVPFEKIKPSETPGEIILPPKPNVECPVCFKSFKLMYYSDKTENLNDVQKKMLNDSWASESNLRVSYLGGKENILKFEAFFNSDEFFKALGKEKLKYVPWFMFALIGYTEDGKSEILLSNYYNENDKDNPSYFTSTFNEKKIREIIEARKCSAKEECKPVFIKMSDDIYKLIIPKGTKYTGELEFKNDNPAFSGKKMKVKLSVDSKTNNQVFVSPPEGIDIESGKTGKIKFTIEAKQDASSERIFLLKSIDYEGGQQQKSFINIDVVVIDCSKPIKTDTGKTPDKITIPDTGKKDIYQIIVSKKPEKLIYGIYYDCYDYECGEVYFNNVKYDCGKCDECNTCVYGMKKDGSMTSGGGTSAGVCRYKEDFDKEGKYKEQVSAEKESEKIETPILNNQVRICSSLEELKSASVKIKVKDNSGASYGSGTIISSKVEGEKIKFWVITAGHLFRLSQTGITLNVGSYNNIPGKREKYEADKSKADIGILTFELSVNSVMLPCVAKVVQPNTPVNPGNKVSSFGFTEESNTCTRNAGEISTMNRYQGAANIQVKERPADNPLPDYSPYFPRPGRSGGGLFNQAFEIIGVLSSADREDKEGLYMAREAFYPFLKELGLESLYTQSSQTVNYGEQIKRSPIIEKTCTKTDKGNIVLAQIDNTKSDYPVSMKFYYPDQLTTPRIREITYSGGKVIKSGDVVTIPKKGVLNLDFKLDSCKEGDIFYLNNQLKQVNTNLFGRDSWFWGRYGYKITKVIDQQTPKKEPDCYLTEKDRLLDKKTGCCKKDDKTNSGKGICAECECTVDLLKVDADGQYGSAFKFVTASTVRIRANRNNENKVNHGTGIIIDINKKTGKALILTAAHVLDSANLRNIKIQYYDETGKHNIYTYDTSTGSFISLIAWDYEGTDLALFEIDIKDAPARIKPFVISKSSGQAGERVVVAGYDMLEKDFLRRKEVVNCKVQADSIMQTNVGNPIRGSATKAKISIVKDKFTPGKSGGPVLNKCGELIGVIHAVNAKAEEYESFFIDISTVKKFLAR